MSNANKHGDLDANGWEYRTLNIMSQNGNIFDGILNIAKADDGRNILFDVELKRKVGKAARTAAQDGSASTNLPKNNIPQTAAKSNTEQTNVAAALEKAKQAAGKSSKLNDAPVLVDHSTKKVAEPIKGKANAYPYLDSSTSTISMDNLLKVVNDKYPDVLSEDLLSHFSNMIIRSRVHL